MITTKYVVYLIILFFIGVVIAHRIGYIEGKLDSESLKIEKGKKYGDSLMDKPKEYVVDYEQWHFESYWSELCECWSVYQAEKVDDGYKLRVHSLNEKPIATVEDAKECIEIWLKTIGEI